MEQHGSVHRGRGKEGMEGVEQVQFKAVDVANSVPRSASLFMMCLFTGFVRDKNHKILPCRFLVQTPVDISGNDS